MVSATQGKGTGRQRVRKLAGIPCGEVETDTTDNRKGTVLGCKGKGKELGGSHQETNELTYS